MKGKNTLWLFLMAMLLNTIMVNVGTSPVTSTKLSIDPRRVPDPGQMGHPGDRFVLSVEVDDVVGLYGAQFTICVEPHCRILGFINAEEGDFLSEGGAYPTAFAWSVDAISGTLEIGITRLGNVAGASGSGTLATFEIYVAGPGDSPIRIDDSILLDCDYGYMYHQTRDSLYVGVKAVLTNVEIQPGRSVKAGENISFCSRVGSRSDIPLLAKVRFDITSVITGETVSFWSGQTLDLTPPSPPPPETLYIDEYDEYHNSGWVNPGASLFGEPDGNYAESSTDGARTSWYSFKDTATSNEIAKITLEGYTQYPNGADENMDIDVYSAIYDWFGSLWGTEEWGWHEVRWASQNMLDIMPSLKDPAELNNLEILLFTYDPASIGGPVRLDSLRLTVEFLTLYLWPVPEENYNLEPFETEDLPPATWVTDASNVGIYIGLATIYYSTSGLLFVAGNTKTFFLRIRR